MEVFLLQHVHVHENGEEDVSLIGVYSTSENAENALQRAKKLPGYRDAPDGFCIDCYRLDEDHWTEGYFTADERYFEDLSRHLAVEEGREPGK